MFNLELNMEPLSPTRPLTLDPETGKRLMRAEGEPTPEPTPEPSPVPSPVPPEMLKQEDEHVVCCKYTHKYCPLTFVFVDLHL